LTVVFVLNESLPLIASNALAGSSDALKLPLDVNLSVGVPYIFTFVMSFVTVLPAASVAENLIVTVSPEALFPSVISAVILSS